MSKKDRVVVDMNWLANGEEDPHPRYIELPREDLAGAHLFSDDELANKLSMMSTISDERDTAMMIDSHRRGDGDYVSKMMLGEIAKDRLRWLSRRVAVLEGRYPGKDTGGLAIPALRPQDPGDSLQQAVAESRLDRQVPLLQAVLDLPKGVHPNTMAALLDERRIRLDSLKVSVALGLFMDKKPIQRWQIYVGIARDLLKQGIYIPFWDDEYSVGGVNKNMLSIAKSKYFGTGKRYQISKLVTMEAPVANASLADILGAAQPSPAGDYHQDTTLPYDGEPADTIDLTPYLPRARELYDSWNSMEGWEPWVEGGNSRAQEEAIRMAIHEAEQGTGNESV